MTNSLTDRYTIYTDKNDIDWSVCFRLDEGNNVKVLRVEYIGNGNIQGRGYYIPNRTIPDKFRHELTVHCAQVAWLSKRRYAA